MQIKVTYRHMEPSDRVRAYVEEKIGRLKKYLVEPIEVNVVLTSEKFRYMAEATINSNGININASEETEDIYSSIDLLSDTLEAQIKKQLEKSRRKKLTLQEKVLSGASPTFSGTEEDNPVVYTESYDPKPMDLEEAILRLNTSKRDFLVFTNSQHGRINVLYRRKDGNYGLIET